MTSTHSTGPRRSGLTLALAVSLALLGALATILEAADPPLLYTLTSNGRLALMGTTLDQLPSAGIVSWSDLAANGADRLALRRDGRLARNGESIAQLPRPDSGDAWIRLEVRDESLIALSALGLLARVDGDGTIVSAAVPADGFFYSDLLAETGAPLLVLRTDGLLIGPELMVVGFLTGGFSSDGFFDGAVPHTTWVRLRWDRDTERVIALRSDGIVFAFEVDELLAQAEPAPPAPFVSPVFGTSEPGTPIPDVGQLIAALPFPDTARQRNATYVDLELRPDPVSTGGLGGAEGDDDPGDIDPLPAWLALRRDGTVFGSDDTANRLVPGQGSPFFGLPPAVDPLGLQSRQGNPFVDLTLIDQTPWRLRSFGHIYQGQPNVPIILVSGTGHVGLIAALASPDLSTLDNRRPVLAVYNVKLTEGQGEDVPIVFTDVDQPLNEPLLEFDFEDLPGATFDAAASVVRLPADLPVGKHRFRVSIDDGAGGKPRRETFRVKVLSRREAGEKNRRPVAGKIRKLQALSGIELVLPILATDRNGDELTIEPRPGGIFELGAVFDPVTQVLRWTPGYADVGPRQASFRISDGQGRRRLNLRLSVKFPLAEVAVPVE